MNDDLGTAKTEGDKHRSPWGITVGWAYLVEPTWLAGPYRGYVQIRWSMRLRHNSEFATEQG